MAESDANLLSIVTDILKRFGIVDTTFINDIISNIKNEKLDEASGTFLDDIGILMADSEYVKTRFAANTKRVANGLQPLRLSEILSLENSYKNVLGGAGLPTTFYDDYSDFQDWIGKQISPDEIKRRVDNGYLAVKNSDPEITNQLKNLYGITDGQLTAYFLDPARMEVELTKSIESARIAAEARNVAGMQLSQAEAEKLQEYGISAGEARTKFGQIYNEQQIYSALPGETSIGREEQLSGVFGTNAAAAQRIAQKKRSRIAEFDTGGGFARTNQFVTEGLRTAGE